MFSDPQMKLSPTEPQSKQLGNSNNWNFCDKENNYNHKTLTHNMIMHISYIKAQKGQLVTHNLC